MGWLRELAGRLEEPLEGAAAIYVQVGGVVVPDVLESLDGEEIAFLAAARRDHEIRLAVRIGLSAAGRAAEVYAEIDGGAAAESKALTDFADAVAAGATQAMASISSRKSGPSMDEFGPFA